MTNLYASAKEFTNFYLCSKSQPLTFTKHTHAYIRTYVCACTLSRTCMRTGESHMQEQHPTTPCILFTIHVPLERNSRSHRAHDYKSRKSAMPPPPPPPSSVVVALNTHVQRHGCVFFVCVSAHKAAYVDSTIIHTHQYICVHKLCSWNTLNNRFEDEIGF